jgi:hypothetical protein
MHCLTVCELLSLPHYRQYLQHSAIHARNEPQLMMTRTISHHGDGDRLSCLGQNAGWEKKLSLKCFEPSPPNWDRSQPQLQITVHRFKSSRCCKELPNSLLIRSIYLYINIAFGPSNLAEFAPPIYATTPKNSQPFPGRRQLTIPARNNVEHFHTIEDAPHDRRQIPRLTFASVHWCHAYFLGLLYITCQRTTINESRTFGSRIWVMD